VTIDAVSVLTLYSIFWGIQARKKYITHWERINL